MASGVLPWQPRPAERGRAPGRAGLRGRSNRWPRCGRDGIDASSGLRGFSSRRLANLARVVVAGERPSALHPAASPAAAQQSWPRPPASNATRTGQSGRLVDARAGGEAFGNGNDGRACSGSPMVKHARRCPVGALQESLAAICRDALQAQQSAGQARGSAAAAARLGRSSAPLACMLFWLGQVGMAGGGRRGRMPAAPRQPWQRWRVFAARSAVTWRALARSTPSQSTVDGVAVAAAICPCVPLSPLPSPRAPRCHTQQTKPPAFAVDVGTITSRARCAASRCWLSSTR